uniref:Uncharacterized protein n=1 Tax=Pseudo-nitzschia australis TaxID=44445 RepID=A0A7S4APQ1_9STRA|mmetsp:Transcript_8314/g.17961  ORF Transcript_8314/g.17961 Transcript_8314/m.17961 type:complete len:772 (+) Transcript_8314:432-2747(+)
MDNANHLADVFADADDDDVYGRVRDPNFHDLEYCNRRRRFRVRFRSLDDSRSCKNNGKDNGEGNGDDDCDCYNPEYDARAAVTCFRPILPSPFRELSYKSRTGWSYNPSARNAPFWDRLGTGIAERIKTTTTTTATTADGFRFGEHQQRRKRRQTKHGRTTTKTNCLKMDLNTNVNSAVEDRAMIAALRVPTPSTTMIVPVSWTSGLPVEQKTNKKNSENKSENITKATPQERKRDGNIVASARPSKRPRVFDDTASVVTNSTAGDSLCAATMNTKNDKDNYTAAADRIVQNKTNAGNKASNSSVTSLKDFSPTTFATMESKSKSATTMANTGLESPKARLYQWYGKKPRKIQVRPEQYATWDNGQMMHKQLFTAVFICPLSKEVFLAGPCSGTGEGTGKKDDNKMSLTVEPDKDGLYWYPRKVMAEHAAAARALGCLLMRDKGGFDGRSSVCENDRFGGLEPYWPSQRPAWPFHRVPARILANLPPDQYSGNITNGAGMEDSTDTKKKGTTTGVSTSASACDKTSAKTNSVGKKANKNSSKPKSIARGTGQGKGREAGHRQARRQPSWNNSNDKNKNRNNKRNDDYFTRNRDIDQYRAQRMPNRHGRYGQQNNQYQPPQQNDPNNHVSSFPSSATQRSTYGQRPMGTTIGHLQQVPLQIPGHSHNENKHYLPQHPDHSQYNFLQQQPNNNQFHYFGNMQHTYSQQQQQQQQQYQQYNQQQYNQSTPIQPPPPPNFVPSNVQKQAWNSQNQNQHQYGSFGNNSSSSKPPYF